MPSNIRWSDKPVEDVDILGEKLTLPFSGLVAPNRFMKGPMTELVCSWDDNDRSKCGVPTDRLVTLYKHWGKGQIGIIISGNIMIHQSHLEGAGNPILEANPSPERLEMFRKYGAVAKAHGSLMIGQISHPGRQVTSDIQPNPVSASDIQLQKNLGPKTFAKPTPLTQEGINDIVERFATTSALLYEAGWDGIQLHGAHGYLIAQFLAQNTNKRTDKYGGSLENRSRLIFEIIAAIRAKVPDPKFSISIKLNSVEFQEGAFDVSECAILCQNLEKAGVDFVDLSGGNYEELAFEHKSESTRKRESFFTVFADLIRPGLKKTLVYVTGGFRTARAMVDAVKAGSCDGIGLARPLADDPRLCARILSKEVDVWAARKPHPVVSGVSMEMMIAGVQIRQVADGIEPIDLSDEKEGGELKRAMEEGHPVVSGYNVLYIEDFAKGL